MTARIRQLFALWRGRRDNAVIQFLSPWKSRVATSILILLFAFFPLAASWTILDPEIPWGRLGRFAEATLWVLYILPLILCYVFLRKNRSESFVQDMWMSSTSPREVVFGICYWPMAILAMGTAAATASGVMVVMFTEPPSDSEVYPALLALPWVVLFVVLRISLDPRLGFLRWAWNFLVEGTATFVGSCLIMATFALIGETLPYTIFRTSRSELIQLGMCIVGPVLLLWAKGDLLVSRATYRYFSHIETLEAGNHLHGYPLAAGLESAPIPPRPRGVLAVITAIATMLFAWGVFAGIVLNLSTVPPRADDDFYFYSDNPPPKTIHERGVFGVPFGACAAVVGTLAGVAVMARRSADGRIALTRNRTGWVAASTVLPFVVGPWAIFAILSGLGVAITMPAAWDLRSGDLLAWLVVTALMFVVQLIIALAMVPKNGQWARLVLGISLVIPSGTLLASHIRGYEVHGVFPSADIEGYALMVCTSLFAVGWFLIRGAQLLPDRLRRELVEQENS